MNKQIKHSIARKLAFRMAVAFASAFFLFLSVSFFLLRHNVRVEMEHYAKSMVAIYADLAVYNANDLEHPIDTSFNDVLSFYGDYMCTWYRVDYMFAYVPDIKNGTITYLSVNWKEKKFGETDEDYMAGDVEEYVLTEEELKVWRGEQQFSVAKSGWFESGTDVSMAVDDDFGNRAMMCITVSISEFMNEMMHGFLIAAVCMSAFIAVLALFLYLFIRRRVSIPAGNISKKMGDYISGGKLSKVKLENANDDEFAMIAQSFNQMTDDIDAYINNISQMEKERERQRSEADIASRIQQGLLSPNYAYLRNCGIKAVMKPAKSVGGDLYDYFELDESRTMIVVADVSGKGIAAAILMAIVLTLIRQYAKIGYGPSDILKNVNLTLSEENSNLMFVTAFVAIYNSATGKLTYSNAGHNLPYLIHNGPVRLEASGGTPLGLFADEEYEDAEVEMADGDSVFLYTDGVTEAVNGNGEFYGTDRLEKVLKETSGTIKKYYVEAVEESLRSFAGETEQNDDITMLSFLARRMPVLELDYDVREFAKIRDCLLDSFLPKSLIMDLCVAAEECFVNICSYAFDGPAPEGEKILFSLEYSNKVVITFSDGGRQFDPRRDLPDTREYDIDTAVGGLGRLIAFTVADTVDYKYEEGRNILTITKLLIK